MNIIELSLSVAIMCGFTTQYLTASTPKPHVQLVQKQRAATANPHSKTEATPQYLQCGQLLPISLLHTTFLQILQIYHCHIFYILQGITNKLGQK